MYCYYGSMPKNDKQGLSFFYPLRSNGISSPPAGWCISSAPKGLYIITRQRVSRLRNDDIQFLAELAIYKDFFFDDIHGFAVIRKRKFKSIRLFVENIFLPTLTQKILVVKTTRIFLSIAKAMVYHHTAGVYIIAVRRISSAPFGAVYHHAPACISASQ